MKKFNVYVRHCLFTYRINQSLRVVQASATVYACYNSRMVSVAPSVYGSIEVAPERSLK